MISGCGRCLIDRKIAAQSWYDDAVSFEFCRSDVHRGDVSRWVIMTDSWIPHHGSSPTNANQLTDLDRVESQLAFCPLQLRTKRARYTNLWEAAQPSDSVRPRYNRTPADFACDQTAR